MLRSDWIDLHADSYYTDSESNPYKLASHTSCMEGVLTPVKKAPSFEEGSTTPPLGSLGSVSPKKRSPVSTTCLHFPDEEMKVSHAEDHHHHYHDSLVRIVHELLPHSCRVVDRNTNRTYEEQPTLVNEKKALSPPQAKPPLRPKPKKLQHHVHGSTRSSSDPTLMQQQQSDVSDDTSQGEEAMMALADDCLQKRDYTTALALYKSLFLELDRAYGRNHGKIALCLHKIGESHLFLGNFQKSIKYLKTAISIRSGLLVETYYDLELANSMDRLAVAKLHLNQVDDAHDLYRQALRIKRSLLGIYHSDVAHISTQLGCIYFYSGEILSAQASFEDALFVYRHLICTTGGSSWTIKASDALCSIGSIKLAQKKYSRSIGCFTEALKAQKQVYGIYHPVVITTLDNLGYAHTKSKNYIVASEVYEEMLHAQVNLSRGYNLECHESLKKLNVVYEKMGKLYAAIDATQEAISQQKRSLSFDDTVFCKTQSMLERLEMKLNVTEKLSPTT